MAICDTTCVDIEWSDVVGARTVADGGYVGDLLTVARAHINEAIRNNELTREAAGEIYTAMIPAALQNGIGFEMQERLTEAKIAVEQEKVLTAEKQREEIEANMLLTAANVALTNARTATEQDKLLTAAKQRDEIDSNMLLTDANISFTNARTDTEQDKLLTAAKQREELEATIELTEAKTDTEQDKLTTASVQREVLGAQERL